MPEKRTKFKDLSAKGQRKFERVMREYADGKLHHGSTGSIVTSRKVALAIAFSEAEEHG